MNYKIKGKVVKGDGYGRKLGFPTVNLETNIKEFPPEGVYAGTVTMDDKEYRAGIVIGSGEKVEAHLLGFRGNAYGKVATFEVKKFIREYKKFDTEKELKEQIKKDIAQC